MTWTENLQAKKVREGETEPQSNECQFQESRAVSGAHWRGRRGHTAERRQVWEGLLGTPATFIGKMRFELV